MNETLARLSAHPDIDAFRSIVWEFAARNPKEYPWRTTSDPWEILVSEVMLQQTQTSRVVNKYRTFLARYPHPGALADSSIEELLGLWKGLGYNRRGLNLKRCAESIVTEHGGRVPNDQDALEALPGIGAYTASAVRAFAFNEPVVLIETNIRRLFLYTFFLDREQVNDREVLEVIAHALDASDPKGWYAALMDLGSALKSWVPNPNRKSTHYAKQARFEGSNRQIRGRILGMLLSGPSTMDELESLPFENTRIEEQVGALEREGFLIEDAGRYRLR
jgi:A/G-specific adenine glycosylase